MAKKRKRTAVNVTIGTEIGESALVLSILGFPDPVVPEKRVYPTTEISIKYMKTGDMKILSDYADKIGGENRKNIIIKQEEKPQEKQEQEKEIVGQLSLFLIRTTRPTGGPVYLIYQPSEYNQVQYV